MKKKFSIVLVMVTLLCTFNICTVSATTEESVNINQNVSYHKLNLNRETVEVMINASKISKGQKITVQICDMKKKKISKVAYLSEKSRKVKFYFHYAQSHYISASTDKGSASISIIKSKLPSESGSSAKKAKVIDDVKTDVLGLNQNTGDCQYYKFKGKKGVEQSLIIAKYSSCINKDAIRIRVYKDNINKKPMIDKKMDGKDGMEGRICMHFKDNEKQSDYYVQVSKCSNDANLCYMVEFNKD